MTPAPPDQARGAAGRPHLLYLAWAFPPCRAAGVYRALATANAFSDAGWRVTVLTTTEDAFERFTGTDPSLTAHVRPDVDVRRIPFDWPAQETDIRTYSRLRVLVPPVWRRLRVWRDRAHFPEAGYGPWRGALTRTAAEVHRDDPVDLVVATANPYVTFAAAHALHRASGVPYVMDYRDAWMLDVFTGGLLHSRRSRAARIERAALADAAEIWFVNEPIRKWHAQEHPTVADRMHVVANGWDPDVLTVPAPAPAEASAAAPARSTSPTAGDDGPVRFGYLGTVTPKVPLAELLAGWRTGVESGGVPQGSTLSIAGYLGYFAVPRAEMSEQITQAGDVGVSYAGPVPKFSVGEHYAHLDALVLALGGGRYVTSGKVFEYVATGKPIVSVHDPDNAAGQVLADYPLWFPARSLATADVAEAFAAAARAVDEADPGRRTAAQEFAAQYRRDRQFAPRVRALTERVAR